MNIWLFGPYGPIPGEGWRDYRFTMLGEALAARGHRVVWWTANYSHHRKHFRSDGWKDIRVSDRFTVRLVPTTSYSRNIGFARMWFECIYAWQSYRRARLELAPDCIVGTDPPQVLGFATVVLGRALRIPVILDVFDLWPELFNLAFPAALKVIAAPVLWPFYRLRRWNLNSSTAIVSLCETYLAMARREAPGVQAERLATIYNGINVEEFRATLRSADIPPRRDDEIWAVFAGTLGNNYDIPTMLVAADILEKRGSRIRIKIAGVGPLLPEVLAHIKAAKPKNLEYLGRLNQKDLIGLYGRSHIGLCAYARGSNVAMPDKAYDYMAAGLPIVNSLRGELERHLSEMSMGIQYEASDSVSLADALESMARDPERLRTFARNSYNASSRFDRAVQYSRYAEFVETIAAPALSARCGAASPVDEASDGLSVRGVRGLDLPSSGKPS